MSAQSAAPFSGPGSGEGRDALRAFPRFFACSALRAAPVAREAGSSTRLFLRGFFFGVPSPSGISCPPGTGSMLEGPGARHLTIFSDSLRAFLKPVVPYLDDAEVSEVLINGPKEVFVERRGKLERTSAVFTEDGLLAAARNMAQFVGRPLSEERPRLDARLPDGSRIHVVLPPIARNGTTIAIRKFSPDKLTIKDLVAKGSMTEEVARFLE